MIVAISNSDVIKLIIQDYQLALMEDEEKIWKHVQHIKPKQHNASRKP